MIKDYNSHTCSMFSNDHLKGEGKKNFSVINVYNSFVRHISNGQ